MSVKEYQFSNLQPDKILATITQLSHRIRERFPTSSLAELCDELRGVSLDASARAERIQKPIVALRIVSGLLVALIVTGVFATALALDTKNSSPSLSEFIQLLEAGINDIVLIGAGIFFLFTLETRIKRNRALDAIHELRSLAHIIDMHQLTKDMTRMEHTKSSPLRPMTPAELERYLDYCSEMLSLVGKVAALYIQHFNETVAIAAVTEVENLTTGLSRKIWQKITLIENHRERLSLQKPASTSVPNESIDENDGTQSALRKPNLVANSPDKPEPRPAPIDAEPEQQKLAKQKLAEQKLAEQKLAEQKLAKQKLAEQKLAKQKLAEQKLAKQKLAEQKLAKQKLAEQKLANKKPES